MDSRPSEFLMNNLSIMYSISSMQAYMRGGEVLNILKPFYLDTNQEDELEEVN